jgi:very-short-patch-repair endonuclease
MSEGLTADGDTTPEPKALRLARYLKAFVGLRSTTVRDVDKYESVLWFSEMPHEPECQSPAWNDDFEPGGPWLEVHKQQFPNWPIIPEILDPWIDQEACKRATVEMPALRSTRLEPDVDAEIGEGEEPPLIARHIEDHPEVIRAYERYRPAWQAWSDEYRRREAVQRVYAELFHLHNQVQKQGEIVELVLGLGLLDWPGSKEKSASIRRHTITARVDLSFDPAAGAIRLEAAADGAQLRIEDDMLEAELRPERGHYTALEEQLKAIDDEIWDLPTMFRAIKSWAEALHAHSEWFPDPQPAIGTADKPAVSFAPALILRKRTQAGMVRIYDTIIDQLSANPDEIPPGWGGLIDDEDDHDDPEPSSVPCEGAGGSSTNLQEIYFPLPANREQHRIVETINHRRGVLVQGPPGTGKSHTIANLICHLLASGKRVLITAETGRALRVLKDKLPENIQGLCVSLLGQGGDAFAELNSAVQAITTRFASWSPGAYDGRIAEVDQELAAARGSLAKIDTELLSLRAAETSPHTLMNGAYYGTVSAVAERIAQERERFGWLQLPIEASEEPPVTGSDLLQWLSIRRTYSDEQVTDAKLRIVDSRDLLSPEIFGAVVTAEQEARQAFQQVRELRDHQSYRWIAAENPEQRAKLERTLRELNARREDLRRRGYDWMAQALEDGFGGRQARWRAVFDQSQAHISRIDQLLENLGSSSISIPPDRDLRRVRADAEAAVNHLETGGKWRRFGIVTPKELKERTYLRDQITVNGQPADTVAHLSLVCTHIEIDLGFTALDDAWADHDGLPRGTERRIRLAAIKEQVESLGDALSYIRACLQLGQDGSADTPAIPAPDWLNGEAEQLLAIIKASTIEEQQLLATEKVTSGLRLLRAARDLHDAHPVVNVLLAAVEDRNVKSYSKAYELLVAIEQTRTDQNLRQDVESALPGAVPGLVDAVVLTIGDRAWDDRLAEWERAWRWAVADNWLRKRADLSYQGNLWQTRQAQEQQIRNLLAEAVALRAWTHFFNRLHSRPREMAAFKAWREAVRAMGRGTGRSTRMERLRREARQYMDQCREAIPVWIMPRYLVAEMVDPAPSRYDVVIVDEASQLGIEGLFLFYIARKMVVVGDDQQISPYGIGIADQAIADLQHHFLKEIPFHFALSAQSSLYANAKIRFGQNIVLREHFRCMPEIIQFSNDLCYASNGTPLDPLRAYPANRLKPLVVRHVKDGYRTGNREYAVNEPEADAIVAQIVACIDDARYADRTMGVISLQGEAQAKLIERKLLETLEPETIEERRLICGDAYAFQGDERHIMFLSMVAAPNERIGTLSNDAARQRFNVAASRAQDQLWLFHSASLDVLSPACMRHHLLKYILNPTRQAPAQQNLSFESKFEQHVFQQIREKGYYVQTQVCVGDQTNRRYRIDLVVEGMQGRLAVECDGDQWHGPESYEQDMARQRDLERAGWQFVRVRGGDFYRDPTKALEPLWAELERLGIKPGGIDEAAAEPPAPAVRQRFERREGDEIEIDPAPITTEEIEAETDLLALDADQQPLTRTDRVGNGKTGTSENTAISCLDEYRSYEGAPGPDPRTVSTGVVADGLVRIIEVEGPMLARRAYDVYMRGCGIRRLGGGLKSTMNKALMSAVRQGRVISQNEPGRTGIIFSTVRIKDSPAVKPRRRGSRNFEEIPPDEIQYIARQIFESGQFEWGSDEHLRAILEAFDLKRLTTQVGAALLEILEGKEQQTRRLLPIEGSLFQDPITPPPTGAIYAPDVRVRTAIMEQAQLLADRKSAVEPEPGAGVRSSD